MNQYYYYIYIKLLHFLFQIEIVHAKSNRPVASLKGVKMIIIYGKICCFLLKGQFTPRIKSLIYIWDLERNIYY